MKQSLKLFAALFVLKVAVAWGAPPADAGSLPSAKEARERAALLHETVAATLHLVHHQYYREDEGLPIPAATLRTVFRELAERKKVELRWLAVNAQAMNVSHEAKTDFEKEAVKAISAGQQEFEVVDGGTYRRVGVITLSSECLKCHLPNRKSNKDRLAGLVISMPVADPQAVTKQ